LATVLAPGRASVVDLLEREHRRGRVTISYDPNLRPALIGAPQDAQPDVERLVGLSDVVKVSDEDLRWLYPDRRDEEVAREWLGLGPALVVVTRGGEGVFAVGPGLQLHRPATPVDLVDTVGAGDSFTSGLLDGLCRADLIGGERRDALAAVDESTLVSVLDAAALIAAITVSRPGADPPTLAEVETVRAAQHSPFTATTSGGTPAPAPVPPGPPATALPPAPAVPVGGPEHAEAHPRIDDDSPGALAPRSHPGGGRPR
jgi:fructokinase